MSTWSAEDNDDDEDDENTDTFNENEDETLQLITEVWVEPQSGRVVGENLAWNEAKGLTFDCIPELVFPIDNEIISCVLTCEHLSLMCKSPTAMTPKEMLEKNNANGNMPDLHVVDTSAEGEKPGSEIKMLPIQWNLTMVLAKSQGVEILCPMFIQNLGKKGNSVVKHCEVVVFRPFDLCTFVN